MREIKIDLKRVFEKEKQPYFRAEYEMRPEDLGIPADVGELTKNVKVKVYIIKNPKEEGYKIDYTIKGGIELTCSRCLEVFEKDIGGNYSVIAKNWEKKEHLGEGDLNVYNLEADTLNLTELVREQIILNVPYKPLCHPECKGVNYEGVADNVSPFAKLKKLLK